MPTKEFTDETEKFSINLAGNELVDSIFQRYEIVISTSKDSLLLYYSNDQKRSLIISQIDFLRDKWVGALK